MPLLPDVEGTATNADASRVDPGPLGASARDPRALRILAKTIYRELRSNGLEAQDVIAVAGELLALVTGEVKDLRCGEVDGAAKRSPGGSR